MAKKDDVEKMHVNRDHGNCIYQTLVSKTQFKHSSLGIMVNSPPIAIVCILLCLWRDIDCAAILIVQNQEHQDLEIADIRVPTRWLL